MPENSKDRGNGGREEERKKKEPREFGGWTGRKGGEGGRETTTAKRAETGEKVGGTHALGTEGWRPICRVAIALKPITVHARE